MVYTVDPRKISYSEVSHTNPKNVPFGVTNVIRPSLDPFHMGPPFMPCVYSETM